MKFCYSTGEEDLAMVHVGELRDGARVECVESIQPPLSHREKWVLIISTLRGCPVSCPICDAGGSYRGLLSADEMFAQLDHLIHKRYPSGTIPVKKLKVQFARMGDPAFNPHVLKVLEDFPERYVAPGFLPSISTVAPKSGSQWLEALTKLKKERFSGGRFQMQFSLHTTDFQARKELVPVSTLSFEEMAAFGQRYFEPGDQKITLNFAACEGYPLEPKALLPYFSPNDFLIKLTPINPTTTSSENGLRGLIDPESPKNNQAIVDRFTEEGYQVILSIGEVRENQIGSNCGMYIDTACKPAKVSTGEQ